MKEYFVWLTKFISGLIIVGFLIPVFLISIIAASQKAFKEEGGSKKNQVAVVELTGIIDSSKETLKSLYKYVKDEDIKGIVLRVDSPGGAVGPSQEVYSAVKSLKSIKPIVVSMGAVAASGGLYSSLGASKVLCNPGTLTGSIGVILEIPNFAKITDKVGLDMITIKSGPLKDAGNSFRAMTPEERNFLQSTVSTAYEDFVSAVVEGRGLKRDDVLKFADGRVILGSQAKEFGLVDGYGDVYDAARISLELAGKPLGAAEMPTLVYPDEKFEQLKKILGSVSRLLPGVATSTRLMAISDLRFN